MALVPQGRSATTPGLVQPGLLFQDHLSVPAPIHSYFLVSLELPMDRDDLKKVYEYQIYMTTFADTKAGGFILLFTGILSGLLSSGKLAYATAMLSGNLALSNVVSVCAFLSLLGSLGLLTWTIIPRS